MTPEIRRAAIRAAAKAALVAGLAGCGGDPKPAPAGPSNAATTEPAAPAAAVDCTTLLAGLATVKQDELPDGDPAKTRPDVYGAVFADRARREAPETQQCCTEELTRSGAQSKLRWECCSALPQDGQVGIACTPWGPPCPPAMPA